MNDFLDNVPSGSIILFKKQHRIISTLISVATNSEWTHCGIVLRGRCDEHMNKTSDERVYILESMLNPGKLNIPRMDGVKLSDLGQRLKATVQPVKFLIIKGLPAETEKLIWKWYSDNRGKNFDRKFFITYFSEVDLGAEFFCSELVAEVLKKLGVIRKDVKTHRMNPGDFEEMFRSLDKVCEGFQLDKSIYYNPDWSSIEERPPFSDSLYMMFLEARCELFGHLPTLKALESAATRGMSRSELADVGKLYERVLNAGDPALSLEILLRGGPLETKKKS